MKPTAAQQMMIDDGLPVAFILSFQERHALWEANPPRNPKPFVDPRLEQDRQLREEEKKHKAQIRIQKMKAGLARKQSQPLSTKGLRWDTRHCKWVSDGAQENPSTQEDLMPKFMITPYDANGQAIKRAVTSIKDDATDEAITAQCQHAANRAGSKAATVNVTAADGSIVKIHQVVREQGANTEASAGPASSEASNETDAEQESGMAAKKRKAAKKPRAKKASGEVRKGSKTEIVAKLLKRSGGCTAAEVLAATKWPSVSMPQLAKNCGLKLSKEKIKGKPTRYWGE